MNSHSHRFLLLLILLGLVGIVPSYAQQTDSGLATSNSKKTNNVESATKIEKPALFDITGVVAQAFNMKKPLRLISPLAPAKEGNGHDHVSWDPDKPDKPKGIILLGIQW